MDFYREKELNIILYFLQNGVKHFTVTKMFKLLFYLDETHLRRTGKQATTLQYRALPFGPVPIDLLDEMRTATGYQVPEDFKDKILIDSVKNRFGSLSNYIKAKGGPIFNADFFSPSELQSLDGVLTMFKEVTAEQISDISHRPEGVWKKTVAEEGENALIDLTHAIISDRESKFDPSLVRSNIEKRRLDLRALRK
jgi:uncharacterized phage-associated protein